jgi:ribosome-associated protein
MAFIASAQPDTGYLMDITKLQRVVVDALEDVKAQDIKVFNTTHLTSLFDRVIIASATSNRQTRALASSVADKTREAGGTVIATEGEETGEWVLVDLGDIIVHVMQPAIRVYYNLEEVWGGKAVRMKLAADSTRPTVVTGDVKFDPMIQREATSTRRVASRTSRPARSPRSTR